MLVEDPPSTKTIADNEPDSSVKDEKNASHDVAETSTIELQVGEKPVASQNKDEVDDDNSKDREVGLSTSSLKHFSFSKTICKLMLIFSCGIN